MSMPAGAVGGGCFARRPGGPGRRVAQESRLRVRLVLAGLPRPVVQYVIERNGAFLARVDLAWPQQRVAVEYDGLWHAAEEQIHYDRRRLNKLLGADWLVLHVTAKRLRDDFTALSLNCGPRCAPVAPKVAADPAVERHAPRFAR